MTYLLDINVLIALFDPAHVDHDAAHRWFASTGSSSWATCPITENGTIRVLSNPAYPTISAAPSEVADRVRVFRSQPSHEFWQEDISLTDTSRFDLTKVRGHQQTTDLYLAGLAVRFGGRLATFDVRIPVWALANAPADATEVISKS